ncbi:MAG: phage portal protein [Phenylobacterium sp.]|nr:phage portal protein [Phenylobacterium sp.]
MAFPFPGRKAKSRIAPLNLESIGAEGDALSPTSGRRRVKLTDPSDWHLGDGSHAGKSVNPSSAMNLSATWACVRLRSRVTGSLGLPVYERMGDGSREVARDHWLYQLTHVSPNADQTPFEFWSGLVGCMDLWGNGYALKDRIGDKIVSLTPLRPDIMGVDRDASGARRYNYRDRGGNQRYTDREILHLRGFTVGGDVGLSAVSYGRHQLGLALAADETAGKTFANGLQVSGFVEMLQGTSMTDDQRNQLLALFERFSGSSRAGKVMPLPPGAKFTALTLNPEDAQLLETRKFSVEDICRWFDTPPILIGHSTEGQTMWGTGLEQVVLGWLMTGLDPLLTGIQQAVGKQLLSPVEQRRFYCEFNRQALMRADAAGRAEFYSKVFQLGTLSPNQIADREGLERFEGGDQRFVNSTFVPIELAGRDRARPPQA